jgi:uncharacterized membrane protein YfcA
MWIIHLAIGLTAGIASGFWGIGGGVILIPALVFMLGLSQHQAQGTTLAIMIPPIGLLAAIKYYTEGNVNLGIAVFVCIGFFIGGWVGAHFVHKLPGPLVKKLFGFLLLFFSVRMIFGK